MAAGGQARQARPILIDRYLQDAIEVDVDCVADGERVFVAGMMEHIEEAGVHSGDSACSLPPYSLAGGDPGRDPPPDRRAGAGARRARPDERPVRGQGRRGLRPRGQPARLAHGAVRRQGDRPADRQDRRPGDGGRALARLRARPSARRTHVAVKEAVFPFARFPGVDLLLGPEMKSTGEVMGLDRDFGAAFAKSQLGAGNHCRPRAWFSSRCATVTSRPWSSSAGVLLALWLQLIATRGTAAASAGRGARGRARQQGVRGPAAHRRPDQGRPDRAGAQHHRGAAGDRRQLHAAPRGAGLQGALLHDGGRRAGGGAGDR